MTKLFLILMVFFSQTNLFAQQCGYDGYYLFVVNVHLENSNKQIDGLKMYLVNERDEPVTAVRSELIDKTWQHIADSFYFWDNGKKQVNDGTKPFIRKNYHRVGNNYIVGFPLASNKLKNPLEYPIYKLKIEAQTVDKSKIEEQFFYLPITKAISICDHHLYSDFHKYKPPTTIDGKPFEPIDIALNQEIQSNAGVVEEKDFIQYAVRFEYTTSATISETANEYIIHTAKIFDTKNGKLHQEIYIPSKSKSVIKGSKNIVEFIDFYGREIVEAKDFSVQIEHWRDLDFKVQRERTNFYVFNTSTRRYELDTALSNYDDVFYYSPLKKMRRYDYIKTSQSTIKNTYQLDNKKWILIDQNETLFIPVLPKTTYAPGQCVVFAEKYHRLPLQVVIGTNPTKAIKDSFWLYNACDDTMYITNIQSPNRDFFSINQTLLPRQKTPLIINAIIRNSSLDFATTSFNCYLTLADNTILSFSIDVPVISNNCVAFYRTDSSLNYAVAKGDNIKFTNSYYTHADGNLRARGKIQDGDTALKVGKWEYYRKGEWQLEEVIYSKAISLSAFEAHYGGQHTDFNIKLLEDGKWRHPVIQLENYAKTFYVTDKTDSIVAYTDTTSYGFNLPYRQIPAEISKQVFLLKPGERSLKIGYYTMPFNTLKDSYALIPDYSRIKTNNSTTHQIVDSMINVLQKRYLKLTQVFVSKNQRGIGLAYLTEKEKTQLLLELKADNTLAFICQLFTTNNTQRTGYCDNKVYAEIRIDKPEDFQQAAMALGFTELRADMGSNRFLLTYKGKIIDEDFFAAFKKLTEHSLVLSAHFNTYFEAEPDSGPR